MADAAFNMAERPVKQLLISYFRLFCDELIETTCAKYNIDKASVPDVYISTGNLANVIDQVPSNFLQHSSIFKIPEKNGEIGLAHETDQYILRLNLIAVSDIPANTLEIMEEKYKVFGAGVTEVKKHHGALLSMVYFVYNYLHKNNSFLEKLIMCIDPSTLSIKLVDTRFKNLAHDIRITVQLTNNEKNND